MKSLKPERVFITEGVFHNPAALARTEAMLAAMTCGEVHRVTEEELNDLVPTLGWKFSNWGTKDDPHDPDMMFTLGHFGPEEALRARSERLPNLRTRDMLGHKTMWYRQDGEVEWRKKTKGVVCQPAWQLHSVEGCPFRCAYCGCGDLIRVITNIEEYLPHFPEWFARAPQQRLWKWDNVTDINCFEPEYDASRVFVEYFAQQPDRFLEIYVGKSDNVDYLLDLDHRGKTILQWSIGGRTQADVFEPETASMEARIEAARKCQEAGYLVRFRFSPMIPVRGWREEYRELVARIFARTRPDVITLCPFGWMDVETARACLDFSLLDPEIVAAMEAAAPFLKQRGYSCGGGRPIPHDARAVFLGAVIEEIQGYNNGTIASLCLETEEMWQVFGPALGMKSGKCLCNCGGHCTPGNEMYDRMVGTQRLAVPA